MKNYQQIIEMIIREAKDKLRDKNRRSSEEYERVLALQAAGKCCTCGKTMEIVFYKEQGKYFYYKLLCGHSHHDITIEEVINIREMYAMKLKEQGKKWHLKIKAGSEESRDETLPKGVKKYMRVDRKNNWYDQIVTDIKTGKITHEEHLPLTKHRDSARNKTAC